MSSERAVHPRLRIDGLRLFGNHLFGYSGLRKAERVLGSFASEALPNLIMSNPRLVNSLSEKLAGERLHVSEELRAEFDRVNTLEDRYAFLVQHRVGQIGLRDLFYDRGVIHCSVCVVPHPFYRSLNTHPDPELSLIGANLGSCVVVLTKELDGSSMLIVQGRAEYDPDRKLGNASYGGTVGASAAGLVSARKISNSGITDVEQASRRNVVEEWEEELGSHAEEVSCVGIAIDYRALHLELGYLSQVRVPFSVLRELAFRKDVVDTPLAFREDFFGVPATEESFKALLRLDVPIPPTHWATLVAAFEYILREKGWASDRIEDEIRNYVAQVGLSQERIDRLCESGLYNPNERADRQGLKSVRQALAEVFGGELQSAIVSAK